MFFCYIDESGDSQAIQTPTDDKQPLLVIAGLFIAAEQISALTAEFIVLKRFFFPGVFKNTAHDLDVLLHEVKGSDIRKEIRDNPTTSPIVQHHFRFLDRVFDICKKYEVRIVARVWAKPFGQPINDKSVYTITTQNIATRFEKYLQDHSSNGIMIADFRDPKKNQYVAHSVFTQKHKKGNGGDAYPSIKETTTFGMSNNHACLQIADLMCSTIIGPIAGRTVLANFVQNVHTHPRYEEILKRYSKRLKALQYHCQHNNIQYWGITVSDPHGKRTSIFP